MRYNRRSYAGIKVVAVAAVVVLMGAAFFFSREMPLLHQKMVKAVDVSRFIK